MATAIAFEKTATQKVVATVSKTFQDYCQVSTLHGLKYVGNSDMSVAARLYWLVSFIAATLGAAYFIATLFGRYEENPIIITLNPTKIHIDSIPFPTITICSMNLFIKETAEIIIYNTTDEDKQILYHACNNELYYNFTSDIKPSNDRIMEVLKAGQQHCSAMVESYIWKGVQYYVIDYEYEHFQPEVVDNMFCCKFNGQSNLRLSTKTQATSKEEKKWDPEVGFGENDNNYNEIPMRTIDAGRKDGLSLTLSSDTDDFFCPSSTYIQGFKVMLSNVIQTAISSDSFLLPAGYEAIVTIEPVVTDADPKVMDVDVKKRQCYFLSERYLKYYRTYSEQNCKVECMINYTISNCSCVPLQLAHRFASEDLTINISICWRTQSKCENKVKSFVDNEARTVCNCLPACTEYNYRKKLTNAQLSDAMSSNTIAHFVFDKDIFNKKSISLLYGISELISNIGGLLGLFMGFSILSIVEIVYFVILSPVHNLLLKLLIRKRKS